MSSLAVSLLFFEGTFILEKNDFLASSAAAKFEEPLLPEITSALYLFISILLIISADL